MSFGTSKKVMLSAVQPSNRLTIGNYLGALKNWVRLQGDHDCIFFAVDLHAITVAQEPEELRGQTYRAVATYIAAGIDPDRAMLFVQSHVPQHAELAWVLTCFAYMGELSRMTQFKDKSAKQGQNIPAGLFAYPVLMAADILLYQADLVPVGDDQKQHVELTRDLAARMNRLYGDDLFKIPAPCPPPIGARIMSLQDPTAKMSKSDPDPNSAIYLSDPDKVIEKKIKRAVTDSGSEITWDDAKPGIKNLLTIQAAITGKSPEEIVAQYAGKQYGHLKVDTAQIVVEAVRPIRERTDQLLQDLSYLDQILARGAEQARERAERTLVEVHRRVGFIPGRPPRPRSPAP
ncbi:MAG: tryptophan--tRNA ligase [Polyangiaceae bacterium]|nr:tryptophan--tRNA ligase [Polyangiaceae bacterium]